MSLENYKLSGVNVRVGIQDSTRLLTIDGQFDFGIVTEWGDFEVSPFMRSGAIINVNGVEVDSAEAEGLICEMLSYCLGSDVLTPDTTLVQGNIGKIMNDGEPKDFFDNYPDIFKLA